MTGAELRAAGFAPLALADRERFAAWFRDNQILDLGFFTLRAYFSEVWIRESPDLFEAAAADEGGLFPLFPRQRNRDPDALRAALFKLDRLWTASGQDLQMSFLTAEQLAFLEQTFEGRTFFSGCDERFSDTLCAREDFFRLSWKNKQKYSDYLRFYREQTPVWEEVGPARADDCRRVMEGWCARRDCRECLFGCEKKVLERFLSDGMPGLLCFLEGRPTALIFGELSGDTLFFPFAKADPVTGLTVALYLEFAGRVPAKFINIGSDGGLEGLKQFKSKFRPFVKLNKYDFTLCPAR